MPLNDYFRADPAPGEFACDGVGVKDADPAVALGQLVAFVRDVPWSPNWIPELARRATAAGDHLYRWMCL